MNKILEKVLKDYKKANQARKQSLILKYGFKTENEFLIYLNNGIVPEPIVKQKTEQPVEAIVKPTVHLVDIIDTSGSMFNKIDASIKGLNQDLNNAITENGKNVEYTHSLYSFNSNGSFKTHYTKLNINGVFIPNFKTKGQTALYDAIGYTLDMLYKLRNEKANEKYLVKIYTDGGENDSVKYNAGSIKELISKLENEGFTITFVGTEVDVKNVINKIKIDVSNTYSYNGTAEGLAQAFFTASVSRSNYAEKLAKGEDVSRGFFKKVGTL